MHNCRHTTHIMFSLQVASSTTFSVFFLLFPQKCKIQLKTISRVNHQANKRTFSGTKDWRHYIADLLQHCSGNDNISCFLKMMVMIWKQWNLRDGHLYQRLWIFCQMLLKGFSLQMPRSSLPMRRPRNSWLKSNCLSRVRCHLGPKFLVVLLPTGGTVFKSLPWRFVEQNEKHKCTNKDIPIECVREFWFGSK